jgi:nucleotide-binding universal stress UspA family protein
VVHFWHPVDPVMAARVGGQPGDGAHLLLAVHADNERAQQTAESTAMAAVAVAQEAGREAFALVERESDASSREALLRALVERHRVGHVVVPATRHSRWRRLLLGASTVERLAADPPCPCTVVPVPSA